MRRTLTLIVLFALGTLMLAQAPQPSRWGSLKTFGLDYVDRATLAVHFQIPIYTRTSLGGAQIGMVLDYNSNLGPGAYGWMLSQPFGTLTSGEDREDQYCGWWNDNTEQYDEWWDLVTDYWDFTEPDGTVGDGSATSQYLAYGGGHEVRGDENDCSSVGGNEGVLIPDGKGYQIVVYGGDAPGATAAAFDSHGDEVDGLFKDPNGNEVTTSTGAGGYTYYHDPLGNDSSGRPALTEGGSASAGSALQFAFTGPNGSQQTIQLKYSSVSVTNPGCQTWSGSPALPTELDLADGSKYQFGYDPAGRVNAITLPTGAIISYSYTVSCPDGGNSALARWDSVNNPGNSAQPKWNWTRTLASGAATTTETGPDQNDGVYNFAAPYWPGTSGALTGAAFYAGTGGSRTEVESVTASNSFTYNYVSGQGLTFELYNSSGSPVLWRQQISQVDGFGNNTGLLDYDWGTCYSCGALLRNVSTTYAHPISGMSAPSEITVSPYSSGGGQISESTFSYDSATGNLLSQNEYVNSSTYLTKSFTYNPNGTVATSTDVNGGQTNYTYGAPGTGGCDDVRGYGVFPTKIQGPVSSAGYSTASWNCVGGVEVSATDANGFTTQVQFSDPANTWRPSATQAADGQWTYMYYPTASNGWSQIERSTSFNSGNSIDDDITTVDGLGQPVLTQKLEAPGGSTYDIVETCFDALGRAVFTSLPYTGSKGTAESCSASAGTTRTFDALSRLLSVTDGGGGTIGYTYTGNDIQTTAGPAPANGENAKNKQEEFDGLGRLESVCEMTSTLSGHGACSQFASQSGYWTTYTRNALGQITALTQNAQGSPTETRSFSFDWLGRLTSETNPESGTSAYVFDSVSDGICSATANGDMVERQDANGNYICYAHDALHRVTGVSYPHGPNAAATPGKSFVYDAANLSDGPASVMQNVKGKLAQATVSGGAIEGFSYPSADEADEYQYSDGTWYRVNEQHYPNGATLSLSAAAQVSGAYTAISGWPAMTYGLDGEGRPTTASAASGQNPVTAANYGVLGLSSITFGSGDSAAYTPDTTSGRLKQYQFTVGGANDVGALSWNANGSLAKLAITDAISGATDNGLTCNYTHDDLARIQEANCGSAYDETFSFDSFGNHNSGGTPTGLQTNFSFTGNRISGASYDSNGNLLSDPLGSGGSNSFDAEGRAVTLQGTGVAFDALERAAEVTPSASYAFLYAPSGAKLAVMQGASLTRADIPLPGGGEAVYNSSGLAYYRHADHLGSAVLSSSPSGGLLSSTHHTPFGWDATGSGAAYRSFTGQKQDTDSTHSGGQYDFMAREYNPIQGRWWTPDPSGLAAVNPENPQSWNRFAYVNGQTDRNVDLGGTWPTGVHNDILEQAFPGLSTDDLKTLENASAAVDMFQDPSHAYMHAQRDGSDSMEDADNKTANFIYDSIDEASQWGPSDPVGLAFAGFAMHTMSDMTSPWHSDANGSPTIWDPTYSTPDLATAAGHLLDEDAAYYWDPLSFVIAHGTQIAQAISNVQAVYWAAYGDKALARAESGAQLAASDSAWMDVFISTGQYPSEILTDQVYGCLMGNPAACPDASDMAFLGMIGNGNGGSDAEYLGFVCFGGRCLAVK